MLLVLASLLLLGRHAAGLLPAFTSWVESLGLWGPVVFVVGYAVATVALAPGSVLTLAAGAIFGLLEGTLVVVAGASLGAALAFLVSRHLARDAIRARIEKRFRFEAVDKAVARKGFRVVFLLRLSPLFPFNLLNYALGLTRVRFRDYLAASVGMLPASFLYVYYGKAVGSLAAIASGVEAERGTEYWLLLGLGLAATVAVTTVVTRTARQALEEEITDVER